MASNVELSERSSPRHQKTRPREEKEEVDYMQRAQWLRAALLGANDGLVTVASLMMGVGSIKEDVKAMLLVGFAGLVAGACSMAIGEFVSVCTQRDIETAQMKRAIETKISLSEIDEQVEVIYYIHVICIWTLEDMLIYLKTKQLYDKLKSILFLTMRITFSTWER